MQQPGTRTVVLLLVNWIETVAYVKAITISQAKWAHYQQSEVPD